MFAASACQLGRCGSPEPAARNRAQRAHGIGSCVPHPDKAANAVDLVVCELMCWWQAMEQILEESGPTAMAEDGEAEQVIILWYSSNDHACSQ